MNLEKALKVTGWTNEAELEWLAARASLCGPDGRILEIGSWQGRSIRAMADNCEGSLWAVDTWSGSAEHKDFLRGKESPEWLYEQFKQNLGDHISAGKVRAVRSESVLAAVIFRSLDLTFDMIFIDGAHDYDNVKADILAWKPLLKKGGLFCGHDFDGGRPGVIKAVRELLPGYRKATAGSIWMLL